MDNSRFRSARGRTPSGSSLQSSELMADFTSGWTQPCQDSNPLVATIRTQAAFIEHGWPSSIAMGEARKIGHDQLIWPAHPVRISLQTIISSISRSRFMAD
ncbi:hypothetical protein ACLOJK_006839 [Asimina triloba]